MTDVYLIGRQFREREVSIDELIPTAFLLSEDMVAKAGKEFDGRVSSLEPLLVYASEDIYLIQKGNETAVFAYQKSLRKVIVHVELDDPEEVSRLQLLAYRAKDVSDVSSIADLSLKVVPQDEYDLIMGIFDDESDILRQLCEE
ncbi:hypothetical protein HOL21_01740 [Candidatus Woesearchaeota archaeon]|jgi:hypothetical protein|nr:hypothetical protein [Candidatus Woesearchaeota archaeon]MBT5396915.1 hypothetical protein [Candidatus Woesearchaeota archaeon]MBT6367108.1 hypothetical protein [Candidatus Woesearchaeota archaeon]MBT7762318.1 hypothetical protein [Candidatus Woesearchaeota archaeon]